MNSLNTLRAKVREQRGAAAVEFAIIVSLLLIIVLGIVEYGRVFNQLEVLNSAAREGARVAAVRGTVTDIRNAVATAAEPYQSQIPASLSITVDGASAGNPPCTDQTQGQDVSVSWSQNVTISLGLLPPFSKTVTIKGVFRCE